MAEQKQQGSERSEPFSARLHILGYFAAFIFLYIEGGRLSNMPIQVVSILFLAGAVLTALGQLPFAVLKKVAKSADDALTLPMYLIAIIGFIQGVVDLVNFTRQVELLWAIPVVLFGITVYDITRLVKVVREDARLRGNNTTIIRLLKVLTFVLLVVVLVVLAFDGKGMDKPIFWLIPAVISLTIVLFLDGTFKK